MVQDVDVQYLERSTDFTFYMKHWKYYAAGSGFAVLAGYVLSNPLVFGICNRVYVFNGRTGCLDSSIKLVGEPLLIFSIPFFLLVISIFFVGKHALKTWLCFAAWWLPLSVVVIYIGSSGGDGLMPFYSYGPSEVAVPMAALFTIISLGIIGWKQFGSKK